MHTTERKRLAVLGLDGVSLSLGRRLCETIGLPALARIVNSEKARGIDAELPELSPVNWTSFYTGEGPEEHGVFGFTLIDPVHYRLGITDFSHVTLPTIFDRLGGKGLTSKVVNLPNTYPARPFPGLLVSGFVAEDLMRAAHPPFMAHMLAREGYKLEADTARGASDPDYLLSELRDTLASRRKALDMFWPDLAWDVFCLVLTETDRLFHFLLPAALHPGHLRHGPCAELLREWDALVGEFLDRFEALPGPKRLLVVADHGFTELVTEVDINAWLRQEGLLATCGVAASEWDASIIAPEARAFALDPGRIYLHTAARFTRGQVSEAEAATLRETIRQRLLHLTFDGRKVIRAVHTREELYPGPHLHRAPDLVCEAEPGFDLKAKFDRTEVFGHFGRSGTHTASDALYYDSLGNPHGATPARLRDTGREILTYFGIDR